MTPAQEALGGRDVDVARAGHEAHRLAHVGAVLDAVREGGDRLRATHGPHLVDAEQGARREDRRVRPAPVVGLRRARDGEAGHLRELGRDDVHDDAARVDGQAAGHVEAHAVDGHPALGDGAALGDPGRRVGAALVGVDEAGPADRLLEGGPHGRVEGLQGAGDDVGGHPQARRSDAVEALGRGVERGGPALADVRDDRAHGIQRGLDVELGPRHRGPQLAQGQAPAAQVEARDGPARGRGGAAGGAEGHVRQSRFRPAGARMPSTPRRALVLPRARLRRMLGHGTTARRREGVQPGRPARRGAPVRARVGVAPAPRPQERQGVRGPDRGDPDGHDLRHRPGVGTRGRLGAQRAGGRRVHDPLAWGRLRVHGADLRRPGGRRGGGARGRAAGSATCRRPGRVHPARPPSPRADRGREPCRLGQAS